MTKEEENQYRRDTYHWRKAHKMCARCGKQDAYTLNGRSKCYECREKENENRRKNYDPEKEREKKQRQYAKREAEGKCVRCGRVKSDNGRKICNKCVAEKHQYNQERSKDIRIYRHDLNLCWFCGSQLDGQKKFDGTQSRICSKCYESRLPYMRKAIEQSIKNREERKPIMNAQEIIEGYTKANTKSNYINKTAKSLKKPKSHIIAELFKSGYKYIELQRSFPNEYATAEKIYQKWLEEGEQEVVQPDQEEQTEELTEEEKLKADMEKTEKINQGLLVEIEELKKKYDESISVTEKYVERIRGLEEEVEEAVADKNEAIIRAQRSGEDYQEEINDLIKEKKKAEEMRDENLRYLQIRDREKDELRKRNEELTERNEELEFEVERATSDSEHYRQEMEALKIKLSAEENEHLDDLEGMDNELNDCEACMHGILGENQQYQREIERLKEDIETLTKMYMKESKKRKKIQKAFIKAVTK